ncbi:hypothetical protein BDV27DRAFT_153320 [Aspergillus caelatus]|uniref:ubiquitinyl hydrolase 1 n=1 Tax=Aspergillus caelatus TaxID=61420 RepID=A0A5N7AHA0_9EURO|nr:uncharacterized protein BDV27DRAFT_153320 [Aspergillus caelatus]KAE8369244.1 hypothetical protein BDV27DRAFT_153320 [Aspergillus caelatus]
MTIPRKCLELIFNHIVLPPRLPSEHDSSVHNIDKHIAQHALNAANTLLGASESDHRDVWDRVKISLDLCHAIHTNSHVDRFALMEAFSKMEQDVGIILYIKNQNSGLYVQQVEGNDGVEQVVFEAFEASPAAESVLQCQDALQCDFPGSAVSIPMARFKEQSFQERLTMFLDQASEERIERFAARARKAGTSLIEARDTPKPHLITQMLMTLLEAQGSQISTPKLRKRLRDDVCWTNAYIPWRRNPLYLVIRVCTQRFLYSLHGPGIGRVYYKFLICAIHAQLLKEVMDVLPVESCHLLVAKLSRRLAKLEVERQDLRGTSYRVAENLFQSHAPWFEAVIHAATRIMEEKWASFKKTVQKRIPALPHRAHQHDLHLKLPNSGSHLRRLLSRPKYVHAKEPLRTSNENVDNVVRSPYTHFANRCSSLKRLETQLKNRYPLSKIAYHDDKCAIIAKDIEHYLDEVSNSYDDCIEQKSAMMVTLFQLWVVMDKYAVHQFPLLKEYRPPFPPEVLDILQLSKYEDLVQLQEIQQYLQQREKQCKFKTLTLFSNPARNCFADRYVSDSRDAGRLQRLDRDIATASSAAKEWKKVELDGINEQYSSLSQRIIAAICTRKQGPPGSGCTHCRLKKQRKKLQITVHEDFLPEESSEQAIIQRRAILFELAMPSCLAAYRDTSWRIITKFGRPRYESMETGSPPARELLSRWDPLRPYAHHHQLRFHLASTTKPFLVSHYKGSALPVTSAQILLPFGLDLSYYDTREERWASHLSSGFTFAHSFGLHQSILTLLGPENASDFAADADGRSSYKVMSVQNSSPGSMTAHEYMAYQNLLAGKASRWLSMLRELGSSNINFSSEPTMHLFNYLAMQVGPSGNGKRLRKVHEVFEDATFCARLATQIESLLQGISDNWRESFCMEALVTFVLRLCSLGPTQAATQGKRLLRTVRETTLRWIHRIREEIGQAVDSEAAQQLGNYTLLAGLLCKRTFAADCGDLRDKSALEMFLRACLAISENMTLSPEQLPAAVRGMLIRDIQMTMEIHGLLQNTIQSHPESLQHAISTVWPDTADRQRTYHPWRFISKSDMWMVSTATASESSRSQLVHYHILDGHLLVDLKPVGKLPAEIRAASSVRELFETQQLLVFPSALKGMTYVLSTLKHGHQIHFGIQEGKVVIRACVRGTTLHFLEKTVFGIGTIPDVPTPLLDEHFHWLDLASGEVEFRRRAHMWWHKRPRNWMLNVSTRQAARGQSLLVDPHSNLFQQIAGIFEHFEAADRLVAFQPVKNNLSVELRRMDLDFTVNENGNLLCRQLRSEVDPNQDAGTWYGLESKIVLRDDENHQRRSIVVPIGSIQYRRQDPHVLVRVANDGRYGRYLIDNTLGRLECPPEPLLVFTKSQLHAFTSFPLPDALTGRTGTEEALSGLASAQSQPWTILGPAQCVPLQTIARLTPVRKYYPSHLKRQQDVTWDKNLTTTIQHDQYRPVIENILAKAERLSMFTSHDIHQLELEPGGAASLRERSYIRRHRFERPDAFPRPTFGSIGSGDASYDSRDKLERNNATGNVFEIINILHTSPSRICTTTNLAQVLDGIPYIKGYIERFQSPQLSDLLDLDIGEEWGRLFMLCRDSNGLHMESMFTLGTLAFADNANMSLLRSLAAICILKDAKGLDLPLHTGYSGFRLDEKPTQESLQASIKRYPEVLKDRAKLDRSYNSSTESESLCRNECHALEEKLLQQWPCRRPSNIKLTATYIDVNKTIDMVRAEWLRLFENFEFSQSLLAIQRVLNQYHAISNPAASNIPLPSLLRYSAPVRNSVIPAVPDFLSKNGPILYPLKSSPWPTLPRREEFVHSAIDYAEHASSDTESRKPKGYRETDELSSILTKLASSRSAVRKAYARDMKDSLTALQRQSTEHDTVEVIPTPANLPAIILEAQGQLRYQLAEICAFFIANDTRYKWLHAGQLWPCTTAVTVLEQLRSTNMYRFGPGMKDALLSYGLSITHVQQLLRIYDASLKNDIQRLQDEYNNRGHESWEPSEFPDWLLMEIEANMLIRKVQVAVARATMLPESKSNSVLQLNMGQGKTSVIMPMVACVLANGHSLARLIVPKALLLQTAQTIQSRLGGLVGREVYHIPFSRKSPTQVASVQEYQALHMESLGKCGIVLTTPEHLLSFKLCGIQCLSDSRLKSASHMISITDWLARVCRDVVDESDFSLAVKTQLVYPSGTQLPLDGQPYRWKIAHALLNLVREYLENAQKEFPASVELVKRANDGFPFIHIFRPDVEFFINQRLADDLCSGRTSILPTPAVGCQQALRGFIANIAVDQSMVTAAMEAFVDPVSIDKVFLLRGLLGHDILLQCLKKRWNVQYGLHPKRDPVAVPFHAKGVPSEQAEWGHPDVAIVLTCLSFYYGGLTIDQLRQSLQQLSDSDDPSSEYDRLTHDVKTLPEPLQHWNLISTDDEGQLREVWNHVRYSVTVINYFLDHMVFPVHARQFSQRLQMSGWDIPLFTTERNSTLCQDSMPGTLTTGFSGTNDNRGLLPLTIRQNDLPELFHTNAEVLTYLLQPRNRLYVPATHSDGKRLSELQFIKMLHEMRIRILIDAGAHILELDNKSFVRKWMEIDHRAPAAVYFDESSKPWVVDRNNKEVPLLASPFAGNLDGCLVYLDEAHTRGTDLKFPPLAKGALTLSLGQTKDHTVQAAMRLRQLGKSQSVVFIASPDVHQSILDVRQKTHSDKLDSADVVGWLLEQSCCSNENLQRLYLTQGYDFCRRLQAASTYNNILSDQHDRQAFLAEITHQEQQTLRQLYMPKSVNRVVRSDVQRPNIIQEFVSELDQQRLDLDTSGVSTLLEFTEVEQERELEAQVEEVRETQHPVFFQPLKFPGLHPAVLKFATTGELRGSIGYEPAFAALQRTALGRKHGVRVVGKSKLFVSTEFTRTIVSARRGDWLDDFLVSAAFDISTGMSLNYTQRPIHWILWSPITNTALVIIPEEAECLVPALRMQKAPTTHLLVYAAPFTRKMTPFNQLDFYAVPPLKDDNRFPTTLKIELGILSGRLYLDFEEYSETLQYLNIVSTSATGAKISGNPAVDERGEFADDPLRFLQEWLAVTRKGREFGHTPAGYICQGRQLSKNHSIFKWSTKTTLMAEDISRLQINGDNTSLNGHEDSESFD